MSIKSGTITRGRVAFQPHDELVALLQGDVPAVIGLGERNLGMVAARGQKQHRYHSHEQDGSKSREHGGSPPHWLGFPPRTTDPSERFRAESPADAIRSSTTPFSLYTFFCVSSRLCKVLFRFRQRKKRLTR